MNILGKLWKWRSIFILGALAGWFWYESVESDKRKASEEIKISAAAEEKRLREDALFKQYNASKIKLRCNIDYDVTLETYGENVTVELRVGVIGNSFPLVVKSASAGKLSYGGLCPGKYFLAVGNDKDVSTTPIKEFVNGQKYTSTVHIAKGVGNMGSSRRERL